MSRRPKKSAPRSRAPRRERLDAATIEAAAQEGAIQLNFGRMASALGAFLAIAYLVTGYVHALLPVDSTAGLPLDPDTMRALLPLGLAVGVGLLAFIHKWGALPTERATGHMFVSAFAFIVPVILVVFVIVQFLYGVPFNADTEPRDTRFLHPIASLGSSLALIGLASAWSGRNRLKAASIGFAAVPPLLLFALVLFEGRTSVIADTLLLAFMTAAVLYPVSGLSLHLLATGTNQDQRLILKSAEHKLKAMDEELGERLRALDYREKAVSGLETDLQVRERELREFEVSSEERRAELTELESKVGTQFRELKELEGSATKMRAELEAKGQESARTDRSLREREAEVQQAKRVLETREVAVGEREQETKRLAIDLKSKERHLVDMESELKDFEGRINQENKRLDEKRTEVVHLEKEMELRESSLKMRIEQSEATLASHEQTRLQEIRDYENKVMLKEREVAKLEIEVRSQIDEFQRREARISADLERATREKESLTARDAELMAREKAVSDAEQKAGRLKAEAETAAAETTRLRDQLAARTTEFDGTFRDSQVKAADLSSKERTLADRLATVDERERQMATVKQTLEAEIKSLNKLNKETLLKERELQRREEELGVRELEMKRRADQAEAAVGDYSERDKSFAERERRLHEREEEFKRFRYEKEKALEMSEQAVQSHEVPLPEGEEETVQVQVAVGGESGVKRVSTGTRRFDDLLLGGLPMNSHTAFIGPPFVGKEVLIYKFIADGLRAKIPAVIVTTTRPPVDVAKEIAPVLPSLLDYERLGLVHWVDASGGGGKASAESNVHRVAKGSDFDAIYEAVAGVDEELGRQGYPYFRLAYLTLSGSVGLSNDEAALGFIQKLINRLRQSQSVGMFSVEGGMHSEQLLQALEHLLDGAVKFKQEGTKRFLSVHGNMEVQTRNWVEYTATNREVNLRAFALERIR